MKVFKIPAKLTIRLCVGAFLVSTWWVILSLHQHSTSRIPAHIHKAWTSVPDNGDAGTRFNVSKLALIMEPRPLPHLAPLIVHMIGVVPPDWRFLFIGSSWSVHGVEKSKAIQYHRDTGKLELVKLPKPWRLEKGEDVSRLMTDVRFYDEFIPAAEWVFRFEHDSILCANSPVSLDEWLSWSWAGLPRYHDGGKISGTGGLSMRRMSVIRRILSFQQRRNNSEPEDVWFGKRIAALPGEKVAAEFHGSISAENSVMHKPIGYHVPERGVHVDRGVWKDKHLRKEVLEYCPELRMILDSKLDREACSDGKGWEIKRPSGGSKSKQHGIYVVSEDDEDADNQGSISPPEPPPFPLVHS